MYRACLKLVMIIYFFSFQALAVENPIDKFVSNIIDDTFVILKDNKKTKDQKAKDVESLISSNMDLEWMSKFVLGRYRRSLTPEQISQFQVLYSQYVVKTYSNAVKSYKDEDIKIKSRVPISENEFAIKTQLLRTNLSPVAIDYLVRKTGDKTYKVFDVVTEGISLINSHQAEFSNIISNNSYDMLLVEIKEKTKKLTSN